MAGIEGQRPANTIFEAVEQKFEAAYAVMIERSLEIVEVDANGDEVLDLNQPEPPHYPLILIRPALARPDIGELMRFTMTDTVIEYTPEYDPEYGEVDSEVKEEEHGFQFMALKSGGAFEVIRLTEERTALRLLGTGEKEDKKDIIANSLLPHEMDDIRPSEEE